ncbi:MAG: hypothetical protein ACPGU1_03235 [Myxococcota bacterium]
MKQLTIVLALSLAVASLGCGDDQGEAPGDAATGAAVASVTGSGADGSTSTDGADATSNPAEETSSTGVESQWEAPVETNAWGLLFEFEARTQGSSENELWFGDGALGAGSDFEMIDTESNLIKSVTDLAGLKNLEEPMSCDLGCVVSPDMKYIAVVTEQNVEGGFSMMLGNFNAQLQVSMFKGVTWDNIIDFQFVDDKLFYTKKSDIGCEYYCQYDFFRVQLPYINERVNILKYPTEGELEQSNYEGHFKVSPDGSKLVMLNTTIRSVTVNMWQEGFGLFELDYICHFGTKGNCTGTGSEYHDQDPVGISPDGRWVAFFTYSERWQRIRLYDTENPGTAYLTIAANVPDGNYISKACEPGNLADWQWERVPNKSNPVFTPDGQEIIFLTQTTCPLSLGGAEPKKPRTNLRRIKLDKLMQGTSLTPDDVFDITGNPFDDVTANKQITSFDLTPDGATLLFTATPTYGQNGSLLGDGSARQRNDRELYRVRIDGENLEQITEDLSFMAHSVRLAPQLVCCDLGEATFPFLEATCLEKQGTPTDASACTEGLW